MAKPVKHGFTFGRDFVAELTGKAGKDGTYSFDLTNAFEMYLRTAGEFLAGVFVKSLAKGRTLADSFDATRNVKTPLRVLVNGFKSDNVAARPTIRSTKSTVSNTKADKIEEVKRDKAEDDKAEDEAPANSEAITPKED